MPKQVDLSWVSILPFWAFETTSPWMVLSTSLPSTTAYDRTPASNHELTLLIPPATVRMDVDWHTQPIIHIFYAKQLKVWVNKFVVAPKVFQQFSSTMNQKSVKGTRRCHVVQEIQWSQSRESFNQIPRKRAEIGRAKPFIFKMGWSLSSAFSSGMVFKDWMTGQLATTLELPAASAEAFWANLMTWQQGTSAKKPREGWWKFRWS